MLNRARTVPPTAAELELDEHRVEPIVDGLVDWRTLVRAAAGDAAPGRPKWGEPVPLPDGRRL